MRFLAAYGVSCRVRAGSIKALRATEARFTPRLDVDVRVLTTRVILGMGSPILLPLT